MKYLWAVLGLLYGVLNLYVAYLLVTAGTGARLAQKGILLQAPPVLGGLALLVLALPLIWNSVRLATAKTEA
jgi:hypothetical protein